MLGFTPVVQAAFGLFLIPIAGEFHWKRAAVSGVFGILAVVMALVYPVAGRLADRFGPRRVIILGNLGFGVAVAALALGDSNILVFYGLYALAGLAGSFASTMMFTRVISGWFDKSRGAMLGVAAGLGNGGGATLMPILALIIMQRAGWRGAYLGLGATVVLIGFPVLFLLLKNPPETDARIGLGAQGACVLEPGIGLAEAAKGSTFWMVLGAIALGGGCMTAVFSHIIPIVADQKVGPGLGTEVVSAFALTTSVWQICVGWILDKVRSPTIIAPFYLVSIAGLALLQHAVQPPALIGAGMLLGVGMGTEYGALPYLVSRYFGLRHYGSIAGVMYAGVMVTQGVIPYLMDASFDAHGSYRQAILVIQIALVVGAMVMATLKPYRAKAKTPPSP